MERKLHRVAYIAALAIGIGISATQVYAEQGTFNLPVRAHWGQAILEPGQHSVSVPLPISERIVYLRSGAARTTQMTVPVSTEAADSERNYLHLSKINGEYYVDYYQSGVTGHRFIFSKPKTNGSENPEPAADEATLVTVTGK